MPQPPEKSTRRRGVQIASLLLLVAAWLATGIYNVAPNQRGVVRFGGRLVDGDVPPGIHYAWPWPLGRVDRPNATGIRRVVIGLSPEDRLLIEQGDMQAIAGSPQTDVLTADINILKASMVVQYQVRDAARYVLRTIAPDDLVRRAAHAALVEALAKMPVDEALTTGKTRLRDAVIAQARALLDAYDAGIAVVSADVQSIEPPNAVSAAFKDVTSAEYDGERVTQRARNSADISVRAAKARAFEQLQAARDDAARQLARARGETAAFTQRLGEYEKAPRVTRERLWLATMEKVMARGRKLVVDQKQGEAPVQVRLLDSDAAAPAVAR